MGRSGGGTGMWCPNCEGITTCRAFPLTEYGETSEQRIYRSDSDEPDINYFQRARECLECEHQFLTCEVDENVIDELEELRGALADIKEHVEAYVGDAKKASRALSKLTSSLKILRALKMYKET